MDPGIEILESEVPPGIVLIWEGRESGIRRVAPVAAQDTVLHLVQGEHQTSNLVGVPGGTIANLKS